MSRLVFAPRPVIALIAIFVYAAVSSVHWARQAVGSHPRVGTDEISVYERRFDRLRPALPRSGMVGYMGHPDPAAPATREMPSPALLHFRRYLLAQYTLAPLLLVENTSPEFVVGNFEAGTEPAAPPGFMRVGAFGDGVILFQRPAP